MAVSYLRVNAGWCETPDHASLDIAGDIDMRIALRHDDWTPTTLKAMFAKYGSAGFLSSYTFQLLNSPSGRLSLTTVDSGGSGQSGQATANPVIADGGLLAVRVTCDVNNGAGQRVYNFYTKATTPATAAVDCESNSGWVLLGSTITTAGATSIRNSTAKLTIGAETVETVPGEFCAASIYAAVLKDGIDGTTVANPDFTPLTPITTTSFIDGTGKTWTLAADAQIRSEEQDKVTQTYIEVLSDAGADTATDRVTKTYAEVMSSTGTIGDRATKTYIEVFSSIDEIPPPPEPQSAHATPVFGVLGCGTWTVQIARRGGEVVLQAPAIAGQMGRVLDDMSQGNATFAIADVPDYCLGALAKLRSWEYELVLLRNGKEGWVGPISNEVIYTRRTVETSCRDLFQWFERRTHPRDRDMEEDLCIIFETYMLDGLERDPSPNIGIDRLKCGIKEQRTALYNDHRYVADSLRELGDDGVDWTMVGRTMRLRGPGQGKNLGRLLASHVVDDSVRLTLDGLAVASEWIVTGETPEGSDFPVSGAAGGVGSITGLVTQVSQQELVPTDEGAKAAAEANLDVSGEEPMLLAATLTETAPFEFEDLIPGNLIDVRMQVGVKHVAEIMTLQSVQAQLAPEKIDVVLSRTGVRPDREREFVPGGA